VNAASAGELAKQFAEIRFLYKKKYCYFGFWLERLTANAKVATVVWGSIQASSDAVGSEGRRQMKQC
jgi:hypothetical protein